MIYRCKNCGREVDAGCLPSATCGLYVLALMGVITWTFAALAGLLRAHMQATSGAEDPAPMEWGWWGLILFPAAVILGLIVVIIGAGILDFFLRLLEYLSMRFQKCPRCGRQNWTWGFTRGFGL